MGTTTSLLPGNELQSQGWIQWPPANSTPRPVGGASGAPGTPDDTWESVASQLGIGAKELIYFNFKTNDPKKVNWYLRNFVGCSTPSPTRWNWMFKGAKPGIIFLPIKDADFSNGQDMTLGPALIDRKWDVPDFSFKDPEWKEKLRERVEKIDKFNIGKVVKGALKLLEVTIGRPTLEAYRKNFEDEYFTGLSLGVVLAADKRPREFVNSHFELHYQVHDNDNNMDHLYQVVYALGLAEGFHYGNRMNEVQRRRLTNFVRWYIDMSQYPSLDPDDLKARYAWNHWNYGRLFTEYYVEAAGVFNDKLRPHLLSGVLQTYLQTHPKARPSSP